MKADYETISQRPTGYRAPLRVAYVLQRFPRISETFILREMYWIREHNVELYVFPLRLIKSELADKDARSLLPHMRTTSSLSWEVIKAQLHFLWHSPGRYLRALVKAVWQAHREPMMLLVVLGFFPKSVYFAWQMESLHIEHVHAHYAWTAAIAAGTASELLDITFTIHTHAFDLFESNQHDVGLRLQNASKVITVSRYNAAYIRGLLPGTDADVVHCGVDPERFIPRAKAAKGDPLTILSVGRLIEKKGQEYLIDACALLAKRGLGFQCYIVGAGPLRRSLQTRIDRYGLQHRVLLLGALGQDRVLELHQHSDIFALPCVVSKKGDRDGLPVAMMEAMACGVPVVATPITGIPELVIDRENGLLVRERDSNGLADALERLLVDESLRQTLGQNARRTIVEEFTIQENTAKLAAAFHGLAARQPVGASL